MFGAARQSATNAWPINQPVNAHFLDKAIIRKLKSSDFPGPWYFGNRDSLALLLNGSIFERQRFRAEAQSGQKILARKHHPDKGGSTQQMDALLRKITKDDWGASQHDRRCMCP
jgi:hypothetical protein